MPDQLEPRRHQAGAKNVKTLVSFVALVMAASAADGTQWIEELGGEVVRDPSGAIVEVSLARTWATDNDIERVAQIKSLKRLDLSFTYVTDRGIEHLQQFQQLEELTLDTAEFITDAAMSYLRANSRLALYGSDGGGSSPLPRCDRRRRACSRSPCASSGSPRARPPRRWWGSRAVSRSRRMPD